jgi:hypothetical protein
MDNEAQKALMHVFGGLVLLLVLAIIGMML